MPRVLLGAGTAFVVAQVHCMHKFVIAFMLIATTLAASPAPDRLPSLRYLVGSWECTYRSGTSSVTYKAVYAYDPDGNWLIEHDTSSGANDEGRFTYDPKRQQWVVVVTGSDRSATIFQGTGDARHLAYHTVYPNTYASETFDRISSEKYTIHFMDTTNGQTTKSTDVCVKQ